MVTILNYISIEKQNNALGAFYVLFKEHYVFCITSIIVLIVAIIITKRRNRLKRIKDLLEKEKAILQEISTSDSAQKESIIERKLINFTELIARLKWILIAFYIYCSPLIIFLWYLAVGLSRTLVIIGIPFYIIIKFKQIFYPKKSKVHIR